MDYCLKQWIKKLSFDVGFTVYKLVAYVFIFIVHIANNSYKQQQRVSDNIWYVT